MAPCRVITDYSDFRVSQSIMLAKAVMVGCARSEKTMLDEVTARELETLTADLERKQTEAADGAHSQVLAKNMANSQLKGLLKKIARMVNYRAEGDLVTLSLTGFPLVKTITRGAEVPAPTAVRAKSGDNSGEAVVEMKAYSGALVYNVLFKDASLGEDDSGWSMAQSTRRKMLVTKLVPGKTYLFKASYKCRSERMAFSDTIRFIAQ